MAAHVTVVVYIVIQYVKQILAFISVAQYSCWSSLSGLEISYNCSIIITEFKTPEFIVDSYILCMGHLIGPVVQSLKGKIYFHFTGFATVTKTIGHFQKVTKFGQSYRNLLMQMG